MSASSQCTDFTNVAFRCGLFAEATSCIGQPQKIQLWKFFVRLEVLDRPELSFRVRTLACEFYFVLELSSIVKITWLIASFLFEYQSVNLYAGTWVHFSCFQHNNFTCYTSRFRPYQIIKLNNIFHRFAHMIFKDFSDSAINNALISCIVSTS